MYLFTKDNKNFSDNSIICLDTRGLDINLNKKITFVYIKNLIFSLSENQILIKYKDTKKLKPIFSLCKETLATLNV